MKENMKECYTITVTNTTGSMHNKQNYLTNQHSLCMTSNFSDSYTAQLLPIFCGAAPYILVYGDLTSKLGMHTWVFLCCTQVNMYMYMDLLFADSIAQQHHLYI